MFPALTQELFIELIQTYSLPILLVLVLLDGVLATIAVAYLIHQDQMSYTVAVLWLILCGVICDTGYYTLGTWLHRGSSLIPVHWKKINQLLSLAQKLRYAFSQYTLGLLIAAKFIHGFGLVVPVLAGMEAMKFPKFITLNAILGALRTLTILHGTTYIIDSPYALTILGAFIIGLFYIAHLIRARVETKSSP